VNALNANEQVGFQKHYRFSIWQIQRLIKLAEI